MGEFFIDERPGSVDDITGGWVSPPVPPGSGSWGGFDDGSGGSGGGAWGGNAGLFDPEIAPFRINQISSGALLADADGRILCCRQSCQRIPSLAAYIYGTGTAGHGRCILVTTTDSQRPVTASAWPRHDGTIATAAAVASWPFGQPGAYRIKSRWQRGHYDYEKISYVFFFIYGVATGWVRLPISGGWTTIATVVVAEDFKLTVNGQPGRLTGNRKILES